MLNMEEYQTWREVQGLSRAAPKYPKRSRPFFISDQAFDGLYKIAERFDIRHGKNASASGVIEQIGLNMLIVYKDEEATTEAYVDSDGLTVEDCYELGKQDYIAKKPMAFGTSALAGTKKRSRIFVEAYAKGYTSGFIDEESEYEPDSFSILFEANSSSNE